MSPRLAPCGITHRHAALPVAGERLEQADQEATRGDDDDQQSAEREQAPQRGAAPPRRPGAVRDDGAAARS